MLQFKLVNREIEYDEEARRLICEAQAGREAEISEEHMLQRIFDFLHEYGEAEVAFTRPHRLRNEDVSYNLDEIKVALKNKIFVF